uniref:Uncharacterized protein n=1 Tax=Marmota marmota marmota TaxID=9994 RepID=A0A8C6ENR5_MARMA
MCSKGPYDYERLLGELVPPPCHPRGGYHIVNSVVPKEPPLLDKPGKGSYTILTLSHFFPPRGTPFSLLLQDVGGSPPRRGDESGFTRTRDDCSVNPQLEDRDMRDGFRRKISTVCITNTPISS